MPRLKLSPVLEKITNIYVQKVPNTVIERTKAHINRDALKLITGIGDDMKDHIATLLKEGEEQGRSISATASTLLRTGLDKGVFKSARKRAYLIARTELHRARQEAAVDIYKAADIKMVKWVGIPDDGRICEKCLALHGKNFNIDNVEQYPPLHPRCRCRLLPADYQLDITVKKQKKGHVATLKLLPTPKDYKYVIKVKKFKKALDVDEVKAKIEKYFKNVTREQLIKDLEDCVTSSTAIEGVHLEKAVPYTQTRRGKLVHVRGYKSRPRLHDLTPESKVEKYLIQENPQAEKALQIVSDIHALGGSALFVGGSVRDALLGKRSKDIDIEVYGVKPEDLQSFLQKHGKVDQVGKSFGVFKVTTDSGTYDVSIPRRESKTGKGHKGFMVEHDPTMTYKEAAGRRDLTINALAYDPLKKTIIDEYGGVKDLKDRVLRATDPDTFGDDSLRVLRVMRFAGQLGFTPDFRLAWLCNQIDLTDLPKERVFGEIEGLLLKSKNPSIGLRLIPILGIKKILPELDALRGVEQEPDWHPEGDAWVHTLMVVDEAAKMRNRLPDPKERLIFMLAALCHDLGKPETTEVREGKITSYGHDDAGAKLTQEFLQRLTDDNYITDKVESLVRHHMKPTMFHQDKVPDSAVRRLSKKVDVPMVVMLSVADKSGRGLEKTDLKAERWLMSRFRRLGLEHPEALNPKVMGRHLIPLGIQPGVEMGRILDKIYNAQLDGKFNTTEEGIEYARSQGWLEQPLTKSRVHKYIKREGAPKHYKYTYKVERSWSNFPLRSDIGEQPTAKDVPPKVTGTGDFILYHGTSDIAAKQIIQSRIIKPDDIGSVGIATIPEAAETYATHKVGQGEPTILELTVSKDWLSKQQLRHEVGGHGHSAFLIGPNYKLGIKATIPPEAIKSVQVYDRGKTFKMEEPEGKTFMPFEELKEKYKVSGKPFEMENIRLKAYRVGELKDSFGRGIFFASDAESVKQYESLHEGYAVKEYDIPLKKVIVAGHQNDLTKLFFNRSYGDMIDGYGGGPEASRKLDKKIKNVLLKRHIEGAVYTNPAPPAKMELMIVHEPQGEPPVKVMTEDELRKNPGLALYIWKRPQIHSPELVELAGKVLGKDKPVGRTYGKKEKSSELVKRELESIFGIKGLKVRRTGQGFWVKDKSEDLYAKISDADAEKYKITVFGSQDFKISFGSPIVDKILSEKVEKSLGGSEMTRLYLDPKKAKEIIKNIRKAREPIIPTKDGWAKRTKEGLILKRMPVKGDEVLIKGDSPFSTVETAFVTAVGKHGITARDEYGNKYQVLHKDVRILANKN
jgi:tRNA nucleotidyltransferase (CCA-adding enzyme)